MTDADHAVRTPGRTLRRVIVIVIIASFGIAALGGIVVLLGAELGDTAARVLGTTAIVGAFSVAVLCCAALVGRSLQAFGVIGAAVSVVAAVLVIWMIWYRGDYGDAWEALMRFTWTAVAVSAGFALASLLLLLADRRQSAVRIGLAVTLGLFGVVLAMVVYLIWWSDTVDDEVFPRVLGIAAILAALGAVTVPVLSLLLRDRPARGGLSAHAVARIEAAAAQRGLHPDALVDRLLAAEPPAPLPPASPSPSPPVPPLPPAPPAAPPVSPPSPPTEPTPPPTEPTPPPSTPPG